MKIEKNNLYCGEFILKGNKLKMKKGSSFKQILPFWLMSLPALIYMIIFNYLPMFGVVLAFKDYNYASGITGSPWVGFKYFKYFFTSNDAVRVLRNTILYNLVFLVLIGLFFGMLLAILLYEIRSKFANKLYQTAMLIPFFLSYVIVFVLAVFVLRRKLFDPNCAQVVVAFPLVALGYCIPIFIVDWDAVLLHPRVN